ncbi:hypothetical protein [Salibacterium halotolerans]|uniref:hypothetical protein n=1 Tax=Salibacterium halotolerans TaxID=1884432 RepID=UPI000B87CD8D|nr:hypothetical protein [Salibacterium halotolerans]
MSSLPRARLASAVPPDQLLVETDGPRPFQGPFAGIEATPELLRDVITTPTGITGEKVADPAVRVYGSSLDWVIRHFRVSGAPLNVIMNDS